jgi:hypothetical protein
MAAIKTWRMKGRKAEYEVIELLQPIVDKCFVEVTGQLGVQLRRNENQTGRASNRFGGPADAFDVAGLDWMALEIKRQEPNDVTLEHRRNIWWNQCKEAAAMKGRGGIILTTPEGHWIYERIPVLIYRRNREQWKARMFVYITMDGGLDFQSGERIRTAADFKFDAFCLWFETKLKMMLTGFKNRNEASKSGNGDNK